MKSFNFHGINYCPLLTTRVVNEPMALLKTSITCLTFDEIPL
ncbi:MAG: CRISPR-associated DxTHG motif protein [Tolypothrix carrinoi HA7290-LM1]|nr:CRISPR-associated DxTHG motif protein [Tolypothrix carrinoi HA7290-LM1]